MSSKGTYENDQETVEHLNRFFTEDIIEEAETLPEKKPKPTSFPVGTILPVFPPKGTGFKLPRGWAVCDGRVIVDPQSPYKNTNLPNLTSDIFLMGSSVTDIGSIGGSNQIAADGNHNHTGRTGGPSSRDGCDNGGDKHPGSHHHSHGFTTSTTGQHNHGGDNRPQFFGVLYIIRIY